LGQIYPGRLRFRVMVRVRVKVRFTRAGLRVRVLCWISGDLRDVQGC